MSVEVPDDCPAMARVWCGDEEVSDDIAESAGKANPFGWSTSDLVHKRWVAGTQVEIKIGTIYCGTITLTDPDYRGELWTTRDGRDQWIPVEKISDIEMREEN